MKNKFRYLVIFITFFTIKTFAQVTATIDHVFVNSQTTVNNCSLINFGSTTNNSITVYFNLSKPLTQAPGNCEIKVMLKYSSSSSLVPVGGSVIVQPTSWSDNTQNSTSTYQGTIIAPIDANQIQVTGSSIKIECNTSNNVKSYSCEYPLQKTAPPSFNFSPTSLSLNCGDTAAKTFTAYSSNIPSGATLTYAWSYTGWNLISSTASSITLQPVSGTNLPGNVTVYPIINGIYQPDIICSVTRTPISTTATMSGVASFCTSSSYTLTGLLAGQTLTWSLSNTTSATLSSTTASTITVTKTGGGDVTLKARISNACGQYYDVTKNLTIGINGIVPVLTTNSGYPYTYPYVNAPESCSTPLYIFTTSSANTNANDPTRKFKFTYGGITIIKQQTIPNGTVVLYASDFNIPLGTIFTIRAYVGNSCGYATGFTPFTLYRPTLCQCGIGNPNDCPLLPRPAPHNSEQSTNEIITFSIFPNPTNDLINIEFTNKDTEIKSNATVELYTILGQLSKKMELKEITNTMDISSLEKGIYILKINNAGIIETQQIVKN